MAFDLVPNTCINYNIFSRVGDSYGLWEKNRECIALLDTDNIFALSLQT